MTDANLMTNQSVALNHWTGNQQLMKTKFVKIGVQAKASNILRLQPFKCEDLSLFFIT